MLLHSTSTLNPQQQLQELPSPGRKGRLRPLGFHPLALVTKDGAVELFFVLKKPGWGWHWAWGHFGGVEGRPLFL